MESQIPFFNLLDNLFDGVYYVDTERRITFWNKAAETITGYSKSEVMGHCCADNILRHIDTEGNELCLTGCPLSQTLLDGEQREAYVFLHHKQGHRIPVHIRISSILDDSGEVIGGVEIFSDNSREQKVLQELEQSRQEKFIDPLLGIGNRRFAEVIFESRQYELKAFQVPYSVVMVDLDDFKEVNDQYGHNIGDQVLQMVVRSIESILRSLDFIIRWGGDEFVLFLPHAAGPGLEDVLKRIQIFVEKSFLMVEGQKVTVSASIGATSALAEDSLVEIIKRVDDLMYRSKEGGKNRFLIG
jgi:diguanylate cyclase (GGDEF)-like protein/PAS domain S-box-containing protein